MCLEMLLTITEVTVGLSVFTFTLCHYLLLTLTLSNIKWCQVSTAPFHTPFVYSMGVCLIFGMMSHSRHYKSVNVSTVDPFCFTSTAVQGPIAIC